MDAVYKLAENAHRLKYAHDEIAAVRHILAMAGHDDIADSLVNVSIALGAARIALREEIENAGNDNS